MGNANHMSLLHQLNAVHPHVHGERIDTVSTIDITTGSSPRTWGTQLRNVRDIGDFRFIPTYMGNALRLSVSFRRFPVHPHVHGERWLTRLTVWVFVGSSPRTWGTLELLIHHHSIRRFIPTYMGNAISFIPNPQIQPVHPHVHGERYNSLPTFRTNYGSSPRTWGTLVLINTNDTSIRFIPTYMGNALYVVGYPLSVTVHPHVHGERTKYRLNRFSSYGSSPRTWGTRL